MHTSTSTDAGFPIRCEVCGTSSLVEVSRPPGDSVCPSCGTFLWVKALVELTRRNSFVPDLCRERLYVTTRDEALRELAQAIGEALQWTVGRQTEFTDALIRREELGSTGIGRGFAIPHAAIDWIDESFTVLAFAPHGINFDALDGKPVHTILVIASPKSRPVDHLRLLERVSRFYFWIGRSGS